MNSDKGIYCSEISKNTGEPCKRKAGADGICGIHRRALAVRSGKIQIVKKPRVRQVRVYQDIPEELAVRAIKEGPDSIQAMKEIVRFSIEKNNDLTMACIVQSEIIERLSRAK